MKKNEKGDAMITVICIMAVFLALSLAAIFSASSLMSGALKSKAREQCRLGAVTFSELLEKELTWKSDYEDQKDPERQVYGLRNYLREQMEGDWRYYNENEAGRKDLDKAKKYFTVDTGSVPGMDENVGEIKVAIYWTAEASAFETYKDYSKAEVAVEVTCEMKEKKQKQIIRTWYRIGYEAYKPDGTTETKDDWEPGEIQNWEAKGEGNYLAWKWEVDGIR